VEDARYLFNRWDPTLGKPLPERSYADHCELYTPNDPSGNPFKHLWVTLSFLVTPKKIFFVFKNPEIIFPPKKKFIFLRIL
jgi:hypothetical protein